MRISSAAWHPVTRALILAGVCGAAGVAIPHLLFRWFWPDQVGDGVLGFVSRTLGNITFPFAMFININVQSRELMVGDLWETAWTNGVAYAALAIPVRVGLRAKAKGRMTLAGLLVGWVAVGMLHAVFEL